MTQPLPEKKEKTEGGQGNKAAWGAAQEEAEEEEAEEEETPELWEVKIWDSGMMKVCQIPPAYMYACMRARTPTNHDWNIHSYRAISAFCDIIITIDHHTKHKSVWQNTLFIDIISLERNHNGRHAFILGCGDLHGVSQVYQSNSLLEKRQVLHSPFPKFSHVRTKLETNTQGPSSQYYGKWCSHWKKGHTGVWPSAKGEAFLHRNSRSLPQKLSPTTGDLDWWKNGGLKGPGWFQAVYKGKPVRWGYKLLVLIDSCNGYTWGFIIYQGKTDMSNDKGSTYNTVMMMMDTKRLGIGYKVFEDNFYTSPAFFSDLLQQKMWAVGPSERTGLGSPKHQWMCWTQNHSVAAWGGFVRVLSYLCCAVTPKMCPYVPPSALPMEMKLSAAKWKMTVETGLWVVCQFLLLWRTTIGMCCVVYLTEFYFSCEITYFLYFCMQFMSLFRCMGGVGVADALIGCYKVLHKTRMWYKTFFITLSTLRLSMHSSCTRSLVKPRDNQQ